MPRSVQCQELEDRLHEAQEETSSTISELRQVSTYPGCKRYHIKRYAGICRLAFALTAAFWHTWNGKLSHMCADVLHCTAGYR